jgi:hypothetical protein
MPNQYYCSDGTRVSQATIDRKRSEAYKKAYGDQPIQICACGERAQGSSHIVSQMRCKHLHRTELIWDRANFYPACNRCNSCWEANDKTLKNYAELMEKLEMLDPDGYRLRINLKS